MTRGPGGKNARRSSRSGHCNFYTKKYASKSGREQIKLEISNSIIVRNFLLKNRRMGNA